ncbi:MAG: SH3 domain-containing protein [Lawsonibacter sp.]|nr:SH3 domain-containing protein [Lawsonibacter sp.]
MNLPKHIGARLAAGLLSASMMIAPAFAATGTVDADGGLRLRNGVGTDAGVLATLPNGAEVEVTGVSEEGWYQVSYQKLEGFVSGNYLVVSPEDVQSLPQVKDPVYGRVTEGPLNVRSQPSTSADKVKKLTEGAIVQINEELEGWYQIEEGYISADYVEIIDAAEAAAATAAASPSSAGAQVVAYAKQFLGYRYVYGGSSPNGFDCSGFTKYIYSNFGVNLSHSGGAQKSAGKAVSAGNMQPGDLVFFAQTGNGRISHVGIYIGGNQFIHASSPSTGVIISSMNDYVARGFVGACRIFN